MRAYQARQAAKCRNKRAKVITDLRTGPWTEAEDAIAANPELFLVEKMAMLQRTERDIKKRIAAIVYGVQVVCGNCAKPFMSPIKGGTPSSYCSKDCRFKASRTLASIDCGYCGRHFRPATAAVKYCSKKCFGKSRTAQHVSKHSKQCPVCAVTFVAAVKRSGGKRAIHCSRACQIKAMAVSRVACVICQTEFAHKSKKTCSVECGIAYRLARNSEYREQWRRPCPQCGQSFIANAISSRNGVLKRRTFCSKDCAVNAHWVRRRAKQPSTGVQVKRSEMAVTTC